MAGISFFSKGRPFSRGSMAGFHKGQSFQPFKLPRASGIHKGITTGLQTFPRPPGATPQNPGPTPPPPGQPSGATTGSSPLDSTYFANVAANQLRVNNQINGLNLQGSQDQTALQNALAQLAYQQPRQQLALEQRANATGGLYSSAEDQNQGNLAHDFATRQGAAQQNYATQARRIASQIAALHGGEGLYESQQAADSANRASAAAANNPALGVTPPAAHPLARAIGRGRVQRAGRGRARPGTILRG